MHGNCVGRLPILLVALAGYSDATSEQYIQDKVVCNKHHVGTDHQASVVEIFRAYLLAVAWFSLPGAPQQNRVGVRAFLPPSAVVQQQLSVDFERHGIPDTVLVYTAPDKSDEVHYVAGIQVLRYAPGSGWALAFEEPEERLSNNLLKIQKLGSTGGQEGVLVIDYYSGAGTATAWDVLAYLNHTFSILDPTNIRKELLDARGYVDNGYNDVKSKGNLVIEKLPGYSRHAARCCPNRPSLEMNFRFTGSSIALESVKELPYHVPQSVSHGPLLHVGAKGFWAYGYQLSDGFLVLGGSESPTENAPSASAALVALRKNLFDHGVLADAGGYLTLTADYKFTSRSLAAAVMLARPAKGRMGWRDQNGRIVAASTGVTSTH